MKTRSKASAAALTLLTVTVLLAGTACVQSKGTCKWPEGEGVFDKAVGITSGDCQEICDRRAAKRATEGKMPDNSCGFDPVQHEIVG